MEHDRNTELANALVHPRQVVDRWSRCSPIGADEISSFFQDVDDAIIVEILESVRPGAMSAHYRVCGCSGRIKPIAAIVAVSFGRKIKVS
jgi:hypothetical protein